MKVIKRRTYGLPAFAAFRHRILVAAADRLSARPTPLDR